MVSKKQNPPPPKPEEESSEEEEVEEEEEEEEVEEEEEEEGHQDKPLLSSSSGEGDEETDSNEEEDQSINQRIQPSSQHVRKPSIQRQSTPPPAEVQNSVSEEEETDSEEEEEEAELTNAEPESLRSPTVSDFTVRPITVPANTKGSKPTAKRSLESSKDDGKGSGNGKKAKTGEENDKKGKGASSAGRIWNEDSELVVLQGMIDYQKRKGPFRPADIGVFYEFIKGKLWDGVAKNQIFDKLKRVKGKYLLNVKKSKNGQDPAFSKPHEKKIFDLSKQIWGGGSESNGIEDKAKIKGGDGKGKKGDNSGSENKKIEDNAKVKSDNPKGKKVDNAGSALIPSMDVDEVEKQDLKMDELKDDDEEDFLSKFPTLSKSFDAEMGFLKENLHLIGNQKAKELEENWKQVKLEEMNVLAKKFNMMSEQIKLVLGAMKR